MQALADLLDGLLHGAGLVALALVVGSVPWALVVVRPAGPAAARALRRAATLLAVGALALACCEAMTLFLRARSLGVAFDLDGLRALAATLPFRAGGARVLLALLVAAATPWLRAAPTHARRWGVVGLLAVVVLAGGAWLVHAAARLEDRPRLMLLTVLHQAGAAVWVGGVLQLFALRRLGGNDPVAAALWPDAVARFGRLAAAALVLLVLPGVPLAIAYLGSWRGLIGTGFGSLVVAKVVLLLAALGLGGASFLAARRGGVAAVRTRVPAQVEAESLVLVALLFTAAALASQPPAIDTPDSQASLGQVAETFRPKRLALQTPSVERKRRDTADPLAVVGWERTTTAYSWSNFSHNVSGLFLLAMSVVALAGHRRWTRHWPLGFVALGVFIFLRASASDGTWPYGAGPPWSGDAEGLQHRLAALLAMALGVVEWRARTARQPGALAWMLPALAGAGGILLLTHAHTAFEGTDAYLVQVTHVVMGVLAILLACGRMLELRLRPPVATWAGTAANLAMLLVALVLLFYREANIVVATG